MAIVIFLVFLTEVIRSRIAFAFPSITMVALRVRWALLSAKTLLTDLSPTLGEMVVKAAGEVVKAEAVARAAATQKNLIINLDKGEVVKKKIDRASRQGYRV
mmetsp:Transcript_31582/g.46287  ORF Transcript_31582/g.46287 Transcript_31582/m.46287 type:complete len:102 (+) Transcript_31582:1152-1457(+)